MKIYSALFLVCLLSASCENGQTMANTHSTEQVRKENELKSDSGMCESGLLNDYIMFKRSCKNNYSDRLDIQECDRLFYSLKKNFSNNYTCETNGSEAPGMLSEATLLADKKSYEEQYYHGSEGQFRCGVYTEQEFKQYIDLCPVEGFANVASAKKCFNKTRYIRERYPHLDCEANLGWYGALFSIFNVESSFEKAKQYLKDNQ